MNSPLPSNETILAFGERIDWRTIEQQKRRFNEKLKELQQTAQGDEFPLDELADACGATLTTTSPTSERGNVILAHVGDAHYVIASFVSARYRFGKPLLRAIVPYNFNPSVNQTNIKDTETGAAMLRAIGAEVELGLYNRDGSPPTEAEVLAYAEGYRNNARRLGITPTVDREACAYQVEVHVAPGVGYLKTRQSLEGILKALMETSHQTGLQTAILASYPILSDFKLTDDPKVHSAVDVMVGINRRFPEYEARRAAAIARYHMHETANAVEVFRNQGCHIHLDIAGRSEALALFTFHTLLRSATALANAALLKGSPFVNGTCDPELLCTREYLRQTTVTGRYLDMPISPHLQPDGLERYANLITSERANAVARALLCDGSLGEDISVMHNPIGRIRPDLSPSKRICTMESTGMPVNVSASRQAAALTDFEFTHLLLEQYYRKHGTNLEPMMEDKTLWAIVGPLSLEEFARQQDLSDREGTDVVLETAAGTRMALSEFYEMKRRYLHRTLAGVAGILPRDIDDVYHSLNRMLEPPSGIVAETVEQYIYDPSCRSTGNWGKILRNAFEEEGGVVGTHNPEAVLRVVNRVHDSLAKRYL